VEAGWSVLTGGGTAREAVQAAVMVMEDAPALNAGRGSVLCREGWVEMDAALMDGTKLQVGAVACVRDVQNPIRLAHEVLASEHVFLVGRGAGAFAGERALRRCDPDDLVVERERARLAAWRRRRAAGQREPDGPGDTVGAVAVDAGGCMAAGNSTGGRVGKHRGRVGDSPVPGAGLYADDLFGAAACTGEGESILRLGLARRAVDFVRDHAAQDAAWLAVRELADRLQGRGGVILISRDGSIGFGFNTTAMPVAYMDRELAEPVVAGLGTQ
jgi:beta-aspartyl-peptidase (threonine type)